MADPVYVALDFETADYQPDSACAVGLAKVRGGEVVVVDGRAIRIEPSA